VSHSVLAVLARSADRVYARDRGPPGVEPGFPLHRPDRLVRLPSATPLLLAVLALAVAPAACTGPTAPPELGWAELHERVRTDFPSVRHTDVDALAARLGVADPTTPGELVLLDARTPEEYAVSHLPGARCAPSRSEALRALEGVPRDAEIVVYCAVGYRSARLARDLARAGFRDVRNLEGSIFAWANAGHPVVRDGAPVSEVHPYDGRWGRLLDRALWPEAW